MVDQLKEGGARLLTSGEIALAKTVFGSTIDYSMVWIHKESYLPFDPQDKNTAMTPNGELYFRDWYRDDLSATLPFLQHLNEPCLATDERDECYRQGLDQLDGELSM